MYIRIRQQKIIHSITILKKRYRLTKISRTIFAVIGAFLLCANNCSNAVEFGTIKYNDAIIDYSTLDKQAVSERADYYFNRALKSKEAKEKQDFLERASGEYFILTRMDPENINYLVQMGRIYDIENENKFAKGYFFNALMLEKNNPKTNFYLGEYYYKRNLYTRALYFYDVALENGYRENYEILIKMAVMYEKLGDLLRANQYYKKAYILNPSNSKISSKIKELESVKYKNTGYYKRTKGKF